MNRIAFAAFAAAMLMGCPEDDKTDSGTETDLTDTETGDCTTEYSGPVTVQEANVTCAADVATIDVMTEGWTGGGYVYTIETANAQPWADEHDLTSYEFDPCGAYDKLKVELTAGEELANLARNESTLFTCDNHYNAGVLTYAAAVLDLQGAVADCMAWGDDPDAVINGTVLSPYNYETGPTFDPSDCVAGAPAR